VLGKPLLLFDMDGTLIIPKEVTSDGKASINTMGLQSRQQMKRVAASFGVPQSEIDSINRMATVWNYARRYAEAHSYGDEKITGMMTGLNEFFSRQEELEHSISVLLPSTVETLEDLKRRHYTLGVVTTASRKGFERISRSNEFGCFGRYFTHSVTRDDCNYIKPDPEPIKKILQHLGRSDFLYIGDSDHDAEAAKAAGGRFILINTRPYDEEMIRKIQPDRMIDRLSELPDLIPEFQGND
jgi:HAD superfamily hydrolase (TIGR01549 family)